MQNALTSGLGASRSSGTARLDVGETVACGSRWRVVEGRFSADQATGGRLAVWQGFGPNFPVGLLASLGLHATVWVVLLGLDGAHAVSTPTIGSEPVWMTWSAGPSASDAAASSVEAAALVPRATVPSNQQRLPTAVAEPLAVNSEKLPQPTSSAEQPVVREAASSDGVVVATAAPAAPPTSVVVGVTVAATLSNVTAGADDGRAVAGGRTQSSSSTPTSNAAGLDSSGLARGWLSMVGRLLMQRAARNYPLEARRASLQGTVFVALTIDARGRFAELGVQRSSGHLSLDRAAIAALRAVGEVPAPPQQLGWRSKSFVMPVVYRLQ